ncbi:MAG: phage tail tape measure protein, partial [Rhodospirillaceae bacterium]|nr:phage tail tape measure protein [Rhodospirillaceae bacterium]
MSKFVLTAQLQLQAPNNVGQVVRQMQSQLNNVNVNVQAKQLPKTTANVNNLTKSLGQANSAAYKLGKTFTSSLKRFAAFSVATRAVSLFTQGIGGAIAEAANFERELIKVAQVTGKSMSALKGLSDEITKLSTNLGVSSNELLNVSRALSQAGFSARETKTALEALAKSDLAPTFENMTKTAEGAIAIFNQFGQGARALEGQLGAINAVAGKFAVEAGDLISVVRRTGGVFKAAGGDLNELLALFTSVRATTRESAESIATGLRTIFTRIQRPSTLKYLDTLGVKLTDMEGKFVGPYEAVRRLSAALSGLEAGDLQFVKIAESLGGFRQIGKVIPLLMQFGVAQEAYNTALGGTTSLSKDAQTAQGSLLVQVQKLKEEWLALVRGFTASPGFKILAQTAISLATALIKVADSLKNILPIMMAIGSVKLFSGLGGFMAGAKGAMGAAVPKFATGGMVPGSGNRDTVPAMLTPGEFVIRKSSVKKLGAQNLKSMNAKGYASGGPVVTLNDNALGGFFLRPQGGTDRDGTLKSKTANGIMSDPDAIKRLRQKAGVPLPELKKTKESALGALSPADAHAKFGGKFNVKGVSKDTPIIKDGEVNSKLVEHYATSTGQSEAD